MCFDVCVWLYMQSSIHHGEKKWNPKAISSTKIHAYTRTRARSQTEEKKREREQHGGKNETEDVLCSRWLKVWIFSLLFTFINSFFFVSLVFSRAHTHKPFFLLLLPFLVGIVVKISLSLLSDDWYWLLVLLSSSSLFVCNYFIYGMKFFFHIFLFCPLWEHGQYYLFTLKRISIENKSMWKLSEKKWKERNTCTHAHNEWMHACTPELLFLWEGKKKN